MTMATGGRSLGKGLGTAAGYGAAALVVVAVAPILRRHPLRTATIRAVSGVTTARSGFELWLETKAAPPPTLFELLLEGLLERPPGVGAQR
jgi:hypothetical protein